MATSAAHPASLARAAIRRQNPRQEPSALDAHAGICAGGSPSPQGEGLSLPRPLLDDGQRQIQPQHLHAALALWDYAARSAAWALGQATGDPLAEQIHAALVRSPDGLTRTQIRDLCQRNLPAERLEQALANLAAAGRAQRQRTLTAGRPAELWTAAQPST